MRRDPVIRQALAMVAAVERAQVTAQWIADRAARTTDVREYEMPKDTTNEAADRAAAEIAERRRRFAENKAKAEAAKNSK